MRDGDDRRRWNARHSGTSVGDPSPFLVESASLLPPSGRALDVAGGTGRNALWLAGRGLDVSLVDVSDTALDIATAEAARRYLALEVMRLDLVTTSPPEGPWAVILCFHYLQRDLFPLLINQLVPGGLLVCEIATVRNLERRPRPPRPFLLEQGEMADVTKPLTPLVLGEGWTDDDRHVARFVGRR